MTVGEPPIRKLLPRRRSGRARRSWRTTSAIRRGGRPARGRRRRAVRLPSWSRRCAPSRPALPRQRRATAAHLDALAAGAPRWSPPASRWGCSSARSTASTRRRPRSRSRARSPPRAGVRCVPLFWLQTEDHDFAEIASATVADRGRQAAPARARRRRGADLGRPPPAGTGDRRPARRARPRRCPRARPPTRRWPCCGPTTGAGQSPAAAFAGVLAALFADDGLLVFDPREAPVAALAAPRLPAGARRGAGAGGGADRPGGGAERGRVRDQIESAPAARCSSSTAAAWPARATACSATARGDGWILVGLRARTPSPTRRCWPLDREPLRLSTSALLRPIVQDTLLPTAAYVGGPGELNYFAQLAPLYDHFGLTPPLVVPRARFRCLDAAHPPAARRSWASRADDVGRPRRELYGAARPADAAPAGLPDPAAVRAQLAGQIAAADADRPRPGGGGAVAGARRGADAGQRRPRARPPRRPLRARPRRARRRPRRPPRSPRGGALPRRRAAGARLRLAVAGRPHRPRAPSSAW